MKAGRPSMTAMRVALQRAAHQVFDAQPRILDDPLAVRIIGPEQEALLRGGRMRNDSPFARRMRAFVLARSRVAEDELAAAVARGVRQYVVLGAGLDTFAYRNPHAAQGLQVFEVDHPATQAWKQRLLAQAGIAGLLDATFVPCDFEKQSWLEALQASGFRADQPAHFAWLGVSMYLSPDDVARTLAAIASLPAGSSVVFDYLVPPSHLPLPVRAVFRVLSFALSFASEPLKSQFTPERVQELLASQGFSRIDDADAGALNARLFQGRPDGLAVGAMGRIVAAQV